VRARKRQATHDEFRSDRMHRAEARQTRHDDSGREKRAAHDGREKYVDEGYPRKKPQAPYDDLHSARELGPQSGQRHCKISSRKDRVDDRMEDNQMQAASARGRRVRDDSGEMHPDEGASNSRTQRSRNEGMGARERNVDETVAHRRSDRRNGAQDQQTWHEDKGRKRSRR